MNIDSEKLAEEAINGLRKLALSKNSGILKLMDVETDGKNIDLFSVTEIKSGNVTVKFADKADALRTLYDIARNADDEDKTEIFIQKIKE